ncbi:MAG: DHH family phosphoesterase [Clostridiales bacterium]|nr:DHH family phosphoesterase [Clostridiales bacterium]
MKLKDFLKYKNIVIQCHDNPDADALASGYALMWFFAQNKKEARFIYRGRNEIQKSNLKKMIKELEVPVKYDPFFTDEPDLLITVDCQYGQKNITTTKAKQVAIIDHHQNVTTLPGMVRIRSDIGSCSTLCWDMIREAGLNPNDSRLLATALYYGLYTDTNRLSEVSHPLDRDMMDTLVINKGTITEMVNSNISLDELQITGKAILNYEYHASNKYLVIEAEACDPCILGVISDFALETENVDVCVAFYQSPYEIKFSVRSCSKEVHADELAAFLAEDLGGGGGGHNLKAGGSIQPDYLKKPARETIEERLVQYYDRYLVIYAKNTKLNISKMQAYEKIAQSLGCVKLTDVFPLGTPINIRTLEGDVDTVIDKDAYLMIGVEGEVYPIKENKLLSSYQLTNFVFTREFEYEPRIKNRVTGEVKHVMPFAKTVRTLGNSIVFAQPLRQPVKLFTAWTEDKYYSGDVGDYLTVRADDEHDIYIVKGELFSKFYKIRHK